MAIKRLTTETVVETTQPSLPPSAPADESITLELELYTNYTLRGETYTKGTPYRFLRSDALRLLAERDNNRPVWKIYQPPVVVREKKIEVVDARSNAVPVVNDPLFDVPAEGRRIDVGDDSEIADILNREDENVTV